EDENNTDYFEYYTDETHVPTVNGVALGSDDFIVADNKSKITWKIGDIRETTKTLRFYVKVKDTLLNDDLLSKDDSLLNEEGAYKTNVKANLSYKEINTGNTVNSGHEMTSPSLGVDTASMKVTYYLSDGLGNIVKDKGQYVILKEATSTKKALHVPYEITPENKIIIDGETYFIYKDDNKTITKTFTEEDTNNLYHVEFRLVKQLNVTFDTNGNGTFENSEKTTELLVDHSTMKVPSLPEIKDIPNDKVFVGWNTDKGGLGKEFTSNTEVNKNMTVYAQWKDKDKYMVIFKDGDNVLGRDSVYAGEDATAPKNVVKEGYTFDKWDKEFNNIQSDLEVNAIFTANKYTVKFDGNGADSGTMTNQEFVYDQTQSLKKNAFVKENYTFTGWLYNGTTYTDEQEVKNLIATNGGIVTLVAQWTENTKYTVTFVDGLGTVLDTQSVYKGKDATAPTAPERAGYTFLGWDLEFTNVSKNLTITALWEAEDTDTPVIPDTPVTPDTPNQPGVPTTPVPPIVPIVRTDPVVTPPAPVQPVQPVQPNPAPQEPEIVVPDNDTPEVKVDDNDTPKAKSSASWALINLICSILTVLLVIVIVLGKRKKEEEDEDEDETIAYKRRKWTMIAGAVVALGSVITFILTENIFLPMILVDKWTLLMAAILLVQVVVLVLAKKWKKEDNEEEATAQA
ncbi:MAG: InlB B-repeat-containing protein, partial [Longicatena sp.]